MEYIIAIDGGSTKTDFVLCDVRGMVLKRLLFESSNPNVVGMKQSQNVLFEGISRLIREYNITQYSSICMFAGISGGSTGGNQLEIAKFLNTAFAGAVVEVDSDAVNAMNLGLKDGNGISVIAGTGSIVFARSNGVFHRIGGWGYLFDMAGSGYDLGRDAIYAALCEYDKTGRQTLITKLLEQEMGGSIADGLDKLYREDKRYIASFAPVVFHAYDMGDAVANEIIQKTVVRLKKMIDTAAQYFTTKSVNVSCTGGLFQSAIMKQRIAENSPHHFIFPALPPVYGAVWQACKMAGYQMPDCFEDNFIKSLARQGELQ